jgi:hypothetical protein
MIELPDDELDKLFRKSSEELNPKYDPLDWQQLSKRLDEEDGVKERGWLRKWSPLVLLLLISTGVITTFLVLRSPDKERANPKAQPVNTSSMTDSNLSEHNRSPKNTVSVNSTESKEVIQDKNSGRSASLTKSNSEKKLPLSRSKAGGVFLEPNRSSGKGGEGAFSLHEKTVVSPPRPGEAETREKARTNDTFSNAARIQDKPAIANKAGNAGARSQAGNEAGDKYEADDTSKFNVGSVGLDATNAQEDLRKEVLAHETDKNDIGVDLKRLSRIQVDAMERHPFLEKTSLPLPLVVPAEPKVQEVEVAGPVDEALPKIAFRFSYAPDLSSVGLKNFTKPGASVSLLGDYGISKRLYLQTGVIWSSKVYEASAGGYRLPKTGHYYGPAPKSVDGTCKVFEIPLNFRYDIAQGKSSRWFAGAGVSSYHMNYEKYQYYFENEDDPKIGNYRGWRGATGWYFMSHLNASAGYEYKLSKKLSLLGEPYVRIPVRRVGYGKVNLFTTGIWLSIRYTPLFR